MEHPVIAQTMLTGYSTKEHSDWERNYKGETKEDIYGSIIKEGDSYFIDEEKNMIHVENMKDYLTDFIGVLFYEGGE